MNIKVLIDMIVRQTTVLIAHLATSAGLRAPLAHLANQVFIELVAELESQGLGRKVIADMFGLALRSYQLKVRRLSESSSVQNRSLWEAVFAYLQSQKRIVTRAQILMHFVHDDESVLRSVLHDLVESGLVFKTGRADATAYRIMAEEEMATVGDPQARLETLLWVWIYRQAPGVEADLWERFSTDQDKVRESLQRLMDDGRVESVETEEGLTYQCTTYFVPLGEPAGFEAALFDHYQAMVGAFCTKLDQRHSALPRDVVGGSTYSFDVWEGHPHYEEAYGLLGEMRERVSNLWSQVDAYSRNQKETLQKSDKVTFYMGQNVILADQEQPGEEES